MLPRRLRPMHAVNNSSPGAGTIMTAELGRRARGRGRGRPARLLRRRPQRACWVGPPTGPAVSGRRPGRRQGAGGGAALRARRGGWAARGAAAAREPGGPAAGRGRARAEPRVRGGRAHLAAAVPAAAAGAGPPRRANPNPKFNPISPLPYPPLPLAPGRTGAPPTRRGPAVSSGEAQGVGWTSGRCARRATRRGSTGARAGETRSGGRAGVGRTVRSSARARRGVALRGWAGTRSGAGV